MAYDINWVPIVELEQGQSVSDKFDTSFGQTQMHLTDIENRLIALEQSISSHSSSINTNSTNISSVTATVNNHTTSITALQNAEYFIYSKASNIVIASDAYQQVLSLPYSIKGGDVMYGISITLDMNTTNSTATIRYRIDTGTTWTDYTFDKKANDDALPFLYMFPKLEATNRSGTILIEAKKGAAGDDTLVEFCDIFVEQKIVI